MMLRQIYKLPVQFSGLCGASVSELSISRSISHDAAMLVDCPWSTMWRPVINENTWSSLCHKVLTCTFTHEIKYMCMNTSRNVLETHKCLRIIERDMFFNPALYHGVMQGESSKMLYSKRRTLWNWEKDLFLVYLQPSFTYGNMCM